MDFWPARKRKISKIFCRSPSDRAQLAPSDSRPLLFCSAKRARCSLSPQPAGGSRAAGGARRAADAGRQARGGSCRALTYYTI